MQKLAHEQAAAIVKLRQSERLKWSALGQYVYRGRRKGVWKAALTEQKLVRVIDDGKCYLGRHRVQRPKGR